MVACLRFVKHVRDYGLGIYKQTVEAAVRESRLFMNIRRAQSNLDDAEVSPASRGSSCLAAEALAKQP